MHLSDINYVIIAQSALKVINFILFILYIPTKVPEIAQPIPIPKSYPWLG